MSEPVVLYQLLILASVIGIGVIVGPKARLWVAIAWAIWTVFMVFTRWLFLFQFLVIFIAFLIGEALEKSKGFPAIQKAVRKTSLWILGLGIVGLGTAIYLDRQRQADYLAPTRSSYIEPAAQSPVSTDPVLYQTPRVVETSQINSTAETEQKKSYECLEKYGKRTIKSFQDIPCGATRY